MFEITLYDPDNPTYTYHNWATENCPSYRRYDGTDVSDLSWSHDYIARFYFEEEQGAILFNLKFGGELSKN